MRIIGKKVCPKCLKLKPKASFKDHPERNICRACYLAYFKDYNRKRYAAERGKEIESERCAERYRALVRPSRMERKRKLIALFGGQCVLCGYNKSAAALDFDHIENQSAPKTTRRKPASTKRRTVSHLLAMNRPEAFELAIEEAKRCRLICANCHRESTFPGHNLNP